MERQCSSLLVKGQAILHSIRHYDTQMPTPLLGLITLESMIMSFPMSANYLFLTKDLGMDAPTVTIYFTTIFIPSFLNSLYGILTDNFPISKSEATRRTDAVPLTPTLSHTTHPRPSLCLSTRMPSMLSLPPHLYHSFGYRRKSYLVFSYSIMTLLFVYQAFFVDSVEAMFIAGTMQSLFNCVSLVACNAVVVSLSKEANSSADLTDTQEGRASKFQSITYILRSCGSMVAMVLSFLLVTIVSHRVIIALTGCFTLLCVVMACLIQDRKVNAKCCSAFVRRESDEWRQASSSLTDTTPVNIDIAVDNLSERKGSYCSILAANAFSLRHLIGPAIFLFSYNVTPSSADAYSVYLASKYSDYYFALFGLIGQSGSLLGGLVYLLYMKKFNLMKVFIAAATLSNLSGLTQIMLVTGNTIGLSPETFICLDSMLVAFTGRIALLPVVVLATQAAPEGLEAFGFAALISLYDVAAVVQGSLTTVLTLGLGIQGSNYDNLWLLIMICNLSSFLPLLLLCCLKLPGSDISTSTGGDSTSKNYRFQKLSTATASDDEREGDNAQGLNSHRVI